MDQIINLISMHLKGKALQWHQTYVKTRSNIGMGWEECIDCLVNCSGDVFHVKSMAELNNLKQEGKWYNTKYI